MNLLVLFLACQFILKINLVTSWSVIDEPLNYFNLTTNSSFIYQYKSDAFDQYRLLKQDPDNRYIILGARNRLITFSLDPDLNQIQTREYQIPYLDTNYPENILATIPIEPLSNNQNNMLICKTGPMCIQARFEQPTGSFLSFNVTATSPTPQFINEMSLENVFYYTSKSSESSRHVLFTASTYRGGQYISRYNSDEGLYQRSEAFKHVGQTLGSEFVFRIRI